MLKQKISKAVSVSLVMLILALIMPLSAGAFYAQTKTKLYILDSKSSINTEQYVQPWTNDLEVFAFDIFNRSKSENIAINELVIKYRSSDYQNSDEISDIKLIKTSTGEILGGPVEVDTSTKTITFSDSFAVEAASKVGVHLEVDVNSTDEGAEDGDIFMFHVASVKAESTISMDKIGINVNATSKKTYIKTPALTVSLTSDSVDQTAVTNQSDIKIAQYLLTANEMSDLDVTEITLHQNSSGTASIQDVDNIKIYRDHGDGELENLVGSGKSISVIDSQVTFQILNLNIEKGKTAKIVVMGDIPSSAIAANIFSLGFEDDSDFIIKDGNGVQGSAKILNGKGNEIGPGEEVNASGAEEDVEVYIFGMGNLDVFLSANTPPSSYLLLGSDMQHVSTYEFKAEDEGFHITNFRIKIESMFTPYTAESVTAVYYNELGEKVTKTAPVSSWEDALFSVSVDEKKQKAIYVEKNGVAKLEIYVDVHEDATAAGILVAIFDHNAMFKAYGESSGMQIIEAGAGDVYGNSHTIVVE